MQCARALQLAWCLSLVSALVMLPVVLRGAEKSPTPRVLESQNLGIHQSRLKKLMEFAGVLVFLAGEFLGIMDVLFGPAFQAPTRGSAHWLRSFGYPLSLISHLWAPGLVSTAVRGVLQTLLSVAVFGDIITTGRISLITIILNEVIIVAQWWFNNTPAATPMFNQMDDNEQGRLSKMENGFLERVRSWHVRVYRLESAGTRQFW
ncbi:hypothetical protein BS47DRAFT_1366922 [Hydnum rufescens UP504]|uniref:Uncharacterized protein n=1 Tax=Hydnum rufescens UP504 TaxID=1448309 RepID=A0A9P6DQX0_9AGAM|nr:hypothetical protein BS47DRAFT_1366922 [Hydnum rufescens UP504]